MAAPTKPLRVLIDVAGVKRIETTLVADDFELHSEKAFAIFSDFPVDPRSCDRVEIINEVRWVATRMDIDHAKTPARAVFELERIAEELG